MGRLLQQLFGLDAPLSADSRARAILSDPWLPGWVLLGILIVVVLYYRWSTRKDGRHLKPRQARTLYAIRVALVLIVLLMLLRPAFDIIENEARLPMTVLLVDESASMTLPAGRSNPLIQRRPGQARNERSRYAAATEAVLQLQEPLAKTHRVAVFTFSDTLDRVKDIAYRGGDETVAETPPEDIRQSLKPPTGEHTGISDAIEGVLAKLKASKVSAIVLMSDGRSTDSDDLSRAIAAAKKRGVPIHTAVCGTKEPPPDLAIKNLIAPDEASLNDVMALRATIINHIRPHLTAELKVLEEGKLVGTQELVLKLGRNDRIITAVPRVKGERRFRLELPEFPDELTYENNAKEFSVQVVERELRVLFIAGAPTIEYHFIVQSLIRDPVLNVSTWLQSADINYVQQGNPADPQRGITENKIIRRLPRTLKDWAEYHVVVLYDIDPNSFSNEQETGLEALVRGGGGLLVIAGRMHGMDKLLQVRGAKMKALLPVEIDKNRPPRYGEAFIRPFRAARTDAGRKHPIFRFEMSPADNDAVWATLPKFYWHHPVVAAKGTAVSLLERIGAPDGRGTVLMALHRYEKGVVFFTALQTLWRWRFPFENYDYDRFWKQLVRYLGETKLLGSQKQVALYTDKPTYSPGESVQVSLAVLDPALFNQLARETILAEVTEQNGAVFRMPMRRLSSEGIAEYRALYRARRVGRYRVNVRHVLSRGSSDQRPLFDESRQFDVELQSLEFAEPAANPEALRKLAIETGGKVFERESLRQLASLAGDISTERQFIPHQIIEDIWDGPLFLFAFLLLITAEWALRKHWDLL